MDRETVILFTRNGLGDAPAELQRLLAANFAGLLAREETPPGKLLFYGEGVKLVCEASPALDALQQLSERGCELVLCRTCLDYFGLLDKVAVGTVKGMPDILAALREAAKVVSV
jgi:intracellular sulfur oxidation DsrE/DsrF family protein